MSQEEVVKLLEEFGSLPVAEIVRLSGCNQSNVNKNLKRLVKGEDVKILKVPSVKGRPVRVVKLNGD